MGKQGLIIGVIGLVIGLVVGNMSPKLFGSDGGDALGSEPTTITGGTVGFVGIEVQGIGKRVAEALGRKPTDGVMIRDVAVGEAGAIAGLRRGDLVMRFGDAKIEKIEDLVSAVGRTKSGQTFAIEFSREGKTLTKSLVTGVKPESWKVSRGAVGNFGAAGFTVAALNSATRQRFGTKWGATGLVVTQVEPGKPAAEVLKPGDIVVQVNLRDVWTLKQVSDAFKV
ncbi:MAG: PDZ domain-containing protein, partial [Proteobacteria bacterium]|nr:PDZ domain-containing protein [Pseudomonadota bacterium]